MREEDTHNTKEIVMLHALRSLVLLVPVLLHFSGNRAAADSADVHVVFATDLSSSMFGKALPNHAQIQSDALRNFFVGFNTSCVGMAVDFLPWGDTVGPPVGMVIKTKAEANRFWSQIAPVTDLPRNGTQHGTAFRAALTLFDNPSVKNILIFTTDEGTQATDGMALFALVPPSVTVYAISLGNNNVFQYVDTQIVSDPARHFHATNSADFAQALDQVFMTVSSQFCLF